MTQMIYRASITLMGLYIRKSVDLGRDGADAQCAKVATINVKAYVPSLPLLEHS